MRGEGVERLPEGDITRAQGREGGEQAPLFHEAAVGGREEPSTRAKGAGHKVDGVAYVVVETRLGVPRAVEKVIPIDVHLSTTGAHWSGSSREEG